MFSKYLHITTSLKGGGGKSTFGCALLDCLRSEHVSVAAFDADGAIGSLSDMHATRDADGQMVKPQDPLIGVQSYNIRDTSRDTLINSLGCEAKHIVHDVAGGALVDMQRLFDDHGSFANLFQTLRECDACAVFWHLVTPDKSTTDSVERHLDMTQNLGDLSTYCRHMAVLNRQGGRDDQAFPHWYGYYDATGELRGGQIRERLHAAGGQELDLPALKERTMSLVKSCQKPFGDAVSDPRLTLIEQQRILMFTKDFAGQLTTPVRTAAGLI
ncbi:hypothetical protein [Sagittula sp. SSi028]|uniref:hypothetical protein n=1 Tax=Sagittula sp. SSi028 TaxID=3400636 RepID=UPI003AF9CC35